MTTISQYLKNQIDYTVTVQYLPLQWQVRNGLSWFFRVELPETVYHFFDRSDTKRCLKNVFNSKTERA
jgi:hypothetical protein